MCRNMFCGNATFYFPTSGWNKNHKNLRHQILFKSLYLLNRTPQPQRHFMVKGFSFMCVKQTLECIK